MKIGRFDMEIHSKKSSWKPFQTGIHCRKTFLKTRTKYTDLPPGKDGAIGLFHLVKNKRSVYVFKEVLNLYLF